MKKRTKQPETVPASALLREYTRQELLALVTERQKQVADLQAEARFHDHQARNCRKGAEKLEVERKEFAAALAVEIGVVVP